MDKKNIVIDSQQNAESQVESSDLTKLRNDKKGKRGIRRIYNAFLYSMSGLKSAWREEEAFRQIIIVSCVLIPLGLYLGESFAIKIMLILPCIVSILAELANSAIENAIDFTSLKLHPYAKNAKDMGSAMQFIACVFMAFVWIFYLVQRFL